MLRTRTCGRPVFSPHLVHDGPAKLKETCDKSATCILASYRDALSHSLVSSAITLDYNMHRIARTRHNRRQDWLPTDDWQSKEQEWSTDLYTDTVVDPVTTSEESTSAVSSSTPANSWCQVPQATDSTDSSSTAWWISETSPSSTTATLPTSTSASTAQVASSNDLLTTPALSPTRATTAPSPARAVDSVYTAPGASRVMPSHSFSSAVDQLTSPSMPAEHVADTADSDAAQTESSADNAATAQSVVESASSSSSVSAQSGRQIKQQQAPTGNGDSHQDTTLLGTGNGPIRTSAPPAQGSPAEIADDGSGGESSLNAGAQAGIVVAALVVLAVLVVLTHTWLRRHRRQRTAAGTFEATLLVLKHISEKPSPVAASMTAIFPSSPGNSSALSAPPSYGRGFRLSGSPGTFHEKTHRPQVSFDDVIANPITAKPVSSRQSAAPMWLQHIGLHRPPQQQPSDLQSVASSSVEPTPRSAHAPRLSFTAPSVDMLASDSTSRPASAQSGNHLTPFHLRTRIPSPTFDTESIATDTTDKSVSPGLNAQLSNSLCQLLPLRDNLFARA